MKDPELWRRFVQEFHNIISSKPDYLNKAHLIQDSIKYGGNVLMFSQVGFPLDLFLGFVATLKYTKFTKKECTYEKHIVYYETPFFIEIDFGHPSNRKMIDLVQDLILSIITNRCIHDEFHLIICKNIDHIDESNAFRVILERFSKNAKFLCTTTSLSKLEAPIKSRFFIVRVPLFTSEQVKEILQYIGGRYHPILENERCRNIIRCIAVADLELQGNDVTNVATYSYPPVQEFMQKKQHTLFEIRDFANKVCANGISFYLIIQDLLRHVPECRKSEFVTAASALEHRLVQTNGGRQPLYYELLMHIAIYGEYHRTSHK